MITFGIDLAAQPNKTAGCRVAWYDGRADLVSLDLGLDDGRLLEIADDVDVIGIDVPFGFPAAYVAALAGYEADGDWPEIQPLRLRYRETDLQVNHATQGRLWPSSASSNLIAVSAWRAAGLVSTLSQPLDRVGSVAPRVVEVHPAAALALWGLDFKGYKTSAAGSRNHAAAEVRAGLVSTLVSQSGVAVDPRDAARMEEDDDLLDAFIAALVTRAAAVGRTALPSDAQLDLAQREGWIHLPAVPLPQLA